MAIRKNNELSEVLSKYNFVIEKADLEENSCLICKGILKNATQSVCGCNFCFNCIVDYLGNDSKVCPSGRISCNEEFLSMGTDIQIDHKANRNIASLEVKCPNEDCTFRDSIGKMQDHLKICEKGIVMCPFMKLGCVENRITKDNIHYHLQSKIHSHCTIVAESIENIINELASLVQLRIDIVAIEAKEKILQQQIEEQSQEIEKLKSNCLGLTQLAEEFLNTTKGTSYQDLIVQVANLEMKLDNVNRSMFKADHFAWKIDDFNLKRKTPRKELTSCPFYSHRRGYKMRLKVLPNGCESSMNKHLFVSFCILKGDFDDRLSWPFKHIVNLSLIDQNSGQDHKAFSFHYDGVADEFKDAFLKPKTSMNRSLGDDEFITFEELYSHDGLIKNDSIVLRCSVNMA